MKPAFATAGMALPQQAKRSSFAGIDAFLWLALAGALFLQFQLALTRAVNWDEFFFYSQIVQFARGEQIEGLNSIHVRLFAWLPQIGSDTIDRILIGRQVMFAAELLTLASIIGISSHFAGRRAGVLCALAYLSSVYVFQHGFAFRVDPLASACAMLSLWLLVAAPLNWRNMAAFAGLSALGAMVTIKLVLLAPAFAGAGLYRWLSDNRRSTLAKLALMALVTAAAFAMLYFLHAPQNASEATRVAARFGERATGYVFSAPTDYGRYFWSHLLQSPILTLAVILAPFALYEAAASRHAKIALGGMLSCLGTFLIYRNALPYFYPFILPPIVCAASIAMARLSARGANWPIALGLAANILLHGAIEPRSPIERQRQIVAAADVIFPAPVTYFDFCAMISDFRKANPFMTAWGISGYMAGGVPIFRNRMERETIPLVLASEQQNFLTFERLLTSEGPSPHFLPADAAALRNNYVRFWGPYWLAGKRIAPQRGRFVDEFLVPGPYTVHGGSLTIDGESFRDGDVMTLERGRHALESTGPEATVLIWGKNLRPPHSPPPHRPYWTDF